MKLPEVSSLKLVSSSYNGRDVIKLVQPVEGVPISLSGFIDTHYFYTKTGDHLDYSTSRVIRGEAVDVDYQLSACLVSIDPEMEKFQALFGTEGSRLFITVGYRVSHGEDDYIFIPPAIMFIVGKGGNQGSSRNNKLFLSNTDFTEFFNQLGTHLDSLEVFEFKIGSYTIGSSLRNYSHEDVRQAGAVSSYPLVLDNSFLDRSSDFKFGLSYSYSDYLVNLVDEHSINSIKNGLAGSSLKTEELVNLIEDKFDLEFWKALERIK